MAVRQLKGYASWVQTVNLAAPIGQPSEQNRLISVKSYFDFDLSYNRIIPREVVDFRLFFKTKESINPVETCSGFYQNRIKIFNLY